MLSHVLNRVVRYALFALMLGVALFVAGAPHESTEASPSTTHWRASDSFNNLLSLAVPTWTANVRSNTDATTFGQHEPGLAVSPANPNVVVVANKDYRTGNIKRVWIEVSTDGGQTWPTQLHMPDLPFTDTESDPVAMARDDGRLYVSCLTTGNNGIFITWSDDNGLTWQPSVPVIQNQTSLQDKDWFAIDNNPSSPFYHRMYMAWAPGGVVSSYSTNGGLNWTSPLQIPNNGTGPLEYPYPVVAPNGDVFLFHLYNWSNRNPNPSIVKTVKSTNGGVSWSQPITIATIYQPPSPPRPGDNWRFFSILSAATDPTNNNRLYVAWTDDRNHNTNGMDVMYSASTDHGATWGPITRLSHDPTGVVRDHITPMLDVDEAGRLHAMWLDRRLDPANRLFHAWYSSSTDGGATWEADSRISDAPGLGFDLNIGLPPGSGNAAGDYWGLDAAGGYVYTAWTDTRNNNQDIYTSRAFQTITTATPTPTRTPTFTVTSTSTSTATNTHTPTPTPIPMLVGHVTWQGRPAQPNPLQALPITLTLKMGTLEINYPSQVTDASGFFTVSTSGLPSGTYDWRVKGPKFLANSGTVVSSELRVANSNNQLLATRNSQLATQVEMGLMLTGDSDNNNVVNIGDFNIVKLSFGKSLGDPDYDDRADFSGDNTVNITDFNLMRNNFGVAGSPPV